MKSDQLVQVSNKVSYNFLPDEIAASDELCEILDQALYDPLDPMLEATALTVSNQTLSDINILNNKLKGLHHEKET